MGKYFGTDGFRGEAGIDLTADHAYKVGRFLGWYYNALRERNGNNEPARIVIGKDTRRSSYMFEYSLVAGLTASGADAYLLHVTTTPSVAYIARVDDFDCGIMISASHNPYYDNGIKLIDCYGEKMPEETLLLVEDYIDGKLHVFDKDWPELPFAHREHIGYTVDYVAGRNRYMGYLISLGIYSFKGVKVGLDCANGASWNIAKSVFDALGADTYVINNKPNGLNINNNAGSTHIEGLQKFVVENGLDVGFAFDGDADRCLCVDEKGNVITGDHILYIYGCYMKECRTHHRAANRRRGLLQRAGVLPHLPDLPTHNTHGVPAHRAAAIGLQAADGDRHPGHGDRPGLRAGQQQLFWPPAAAGDRAFALGLPGKMAEDNPLTAGSIGTIIGLKLAYANQRSDIPCNLRQGATGRARPFCSSTPWA